MQIVSPSYEIVSPTIEDAKGILPGLERVARTCYKSEDKICEGSDVKLIRNIIKRGHEAMLEHDYMKVWFRCDRGVSHELVRHRIGVAFAQESTRWVDYTKGISVICPPEIKNNSVAFEEWRKAMLQSEDSYKGLRQFASDEISRNAARSVLPTCLATEIWVTANLREWRHIFKLRAAKAAHPQMRELMIPLLADAKKLIPVIFDDIEVE